MSIGRKYNTEISPNISGIQTAQFDPLSIDPDYVEGLFWYDDNKKSFSVYEESSNSILQVGQELRVRCENISGVQINDGEIVYISGASEFPQITCAQADKPSTSQIIGMATVDIPNNEKGKVTIKGIVRGINTSSFSPGDPVYLSALIPGGITATKPTGLNQIVRVGSVVNSDLTNGTVLVDPVNIGRAEAPRAEMWENDSAVETVINTINVWEKIVAITNDGDTLGFTFDGAGGFTVDNIEEIGGVYKVDVKVSSSVVSPNKDFEMAVFINGNIQNNTKSKRRYSSSDTGIQAAGGLIHLSIGDIVDFRVRNLTDSSNIIIVNINFSLIRSGT